MLSKLANYFRGKGEAEEKPRELKFDQALGSILGKARADLYYKRDNSFELLLEDAHLSFLAESVLFVGTCALPSDVSSEQLSGVSMSQFGSEKGVEFRYDGIGQFRQHSPEMFQWYMDSRTANHEEFGLVFASEESAHEFHRAILARLLASTFSQVMACPCSIDEHKRLAGKWVSVEPDAVVQLVQSADGRQAKVLLFKAADFAKVLSSETGGSQEKQDDAEAEAEGDAEDAGAAYQRKTSGASEEEDAFERPSGEGDSTPPREAPPSQKTLPIPLFYFEVSVGEYITPLPELNQMQWWGAALDEPGAQKRLYRICFGQEGQTASEKKKASEKFLGKFGLVFADVCANKRLAAEDGGESVVDPSDFFDARATSSESGDCGAFEIEAHDGDPSEDEEGLPLVSRDPSKDVLRSSPSSMVNQFFEAGTSHSVICRAGAGEKSDFQLMRFTDPDNFSVVATIDGGKCRIGNKTVDPKCAMLHCEERQLIVLDKTEREAAVLMDLETEKVVRELDAGGYEISHVLPATLNGKSSPDATFNAFNDRAFFNMDSRLPNSARTHTFNYARKQGFTSGATTAAGGIALGSSRSVLRLYDGKYSRPGVLKRAKTQLFGFGDPFLHVAVSTDGEWVLTTCPSYLLLFNVKKLPEGDEAPGPHYKTTGFNSSLGRFRRKPIVLHLSLEDVSKFNLQNCSFSKAEFSQDGLTIVTATNNLVVVWDFEAVKRGKLEAYRVCPNSDYLKDVAFCRRGEEDAIVMVTPCSVTARGLRRTSRKSKD